MSRDLQRDWALGDAKSAKVGKYSNSAFLDGQGQAGNPYVKKSLRDGDGSDVQVRGKSADSIATRFRDVKRATGHPHLAPPIDWMEIPSGGAAGSTAPHPYLDPILYLEGMYQHSLDEWQRFVVGEPGQIEAIWRNLIAKGDPLWVGNQDAIIDPMRTLIFSLHGDGAPTHKTDGVFTFSFGSVTGRGQTREIRQLFTVIRKSCIADGTFARIFDRLAWYANALLEGGYPPRDWKGRKYAKAGQPINLGGWKIAFMHLKGDWEFFSKCWVFQLRMQFPIIVSNVRLRQTWTIFFIPGRMQALDGAARSGLMLSIWRNWCGMARRYQGFLRLGLFCMRVL